MNLPVNFLKTFLPELIEKNVKIETIGFYEGLPQSPIDAIDFAKAKTQAQYWVNSCVCYKLWWTS